MLACTVLCWSQSMESDAIGRECRRQSSGTTWVALTDIPRPGADVAGLALMFLKDCKTPQKPPSRNLGKKTVSITHKSWRAPSNAKGHAAGHE